MICNTSKGFTLVEILIAVTLSGVIFLGVSRIMIGLFQSNARVRQIDRIAQTKNDLAIELTHAVRWAKTIIFQPQTVRIVSADNATSTYTFANGQLYKNTVAISSEDVIITDFIAKNIGNSSSLPLVEISFTIQDKQFTTVSHAVRFVVSQRVTSITSGT